MRVLTQFPEGSRQANAKRGKSGKTRVQIYLIATVMSACRGAGGGRRVVANGTLLQRGEGEGSGPLKTWDEDETD